MASRPVTVINRNPSRVVIHGATADKSTNGTIIGAKASAEPNGLYPKINCRYWTRTRKTPNVTRNWMVMENDPLPKPRRAKNRTSSSG